MSQIPTLTDASLTLENRVATLTFQRDDVRNALTGTGLVDDIVQTVAWANLNREVSALVITGDGKAFSSGGNVKEMRDQQGMFGGAAAEIQEQYRQGIQRIPLAMHDIEVPTIAAINGAAIGAGFDLANMCDIRIGCPNTLLGETFINLGIIPGDGGAWFLQRVAGYQRAAELTLTGRLIQAAEALEYGILMEVVADEELLPRAQSIAAEIAAKPPRGVRMTKRLLKAAQRMELKDLLDMSASLQAISHQMDDHREAVSAFLDKRDPSYKGD
ncbi:MAG: enoyl-CoA hydratase-related protein [Halieaceae bacterium]|nr:enoyl-CoA hydratase-related protein [Halieaceae bacterium]